MISVLILTLDEAENLPACLESVRWSDDVLVLDSFSTDSTVEVARRLGARVMQHRFVDFAGQRNFGQQQGNLKHEWVLHLDADERVTPELHQEMVAAVQRGDKDAYRIASRMMFEGRWLKHAGLYPSYQVRFGRRACLSFCQVGHGQREQSPSGRIGTFAAPLIHYSFSKGLHDWVEKHNRYSSAEALHSVEASLSGPVDWAGFFSPVDTVRRRRAWKHLSCFLPFRPTLRFLYMYVFRLGFLDGLAGLAYCRLLRIYEYLIVLKMREARRRKQDSTL